jgi:NADPH-dependent 2,4-dienoyl-CoA reductase/sulfur reductase-like enzyme/Fe-S-cluster-containing hydrogenase component 2
MNRIENHPVLDNIEHRKEISFTFNGKSLKAYEGEMISSSLFANGIKEFSIHKKGDAHQGIFCANGQCAQCTVMVNGTPLKSCVTQLKSGMEIETLKHLPAIPDDDSPLGKHRDKNVKCDVLVVGGGPSGLTSTIELAKLGLKVVLVDDKDKLGGKLLLQTHKFFGSEEDCYAGVRGYDIGKLLEDEARSYKNVTIYTDSSVVGIYKDQKAGIFANNKNYIIVDFDGIIISTGAREKSLVFPGNDLPGVYGAGAFQTLVNRDLIRAADKVMIIGSGNVGLIGAYHALQAGIEVAGIIEIANEISGYKVHADKIRRMGVPIYLNTTIISAEGKDKVERVTIAEVDENWNPVLETARTFDVDTLLVAAGLTPADEFFDMSDDFEFKVVKAGDAEEIAEASSAMFGGKIAGLKMAKLLGEDVVVDDTYFKKADILKSKPGAVLKKDELELTDSYQPVFTCLEEIPCNPCTTVCPKNAITLKNKSGTIMDVPELSGECIGCGLCVAICPGLAITLARKNSDGKADVMLAHEYSIDFKVGDKLPMMDMDGTFLEEAVVKKITFNKKYSTNLVTVESTLENATEIAGVLVQDKKHTKAREKAEFTHMPENGIVCRCERVTLKEVVDFIKENSVRDINQLKQIRVGMGACGSKTCSVQFPRVFKEAGVDWSEVAEGSIRPLSVETPMYALINEEIEGV